MTLIPLSGAELQAARKKAAQRFKTIAEKHTPEDVLCVYRKSLTGRAWPRKRQMEAPEPTTRRRLHIYLHEVAHIVLNHVGKKPKHVEEMEAEKWAFDVMRAEGVPIPRKSTASAKRYVGWKIKQAIRRGAKHINQEAAAFAKR